jgi:hypothetical protein
MSLGDAYLAQKKANQAANSIGFRIPRISGPKCKNCGEELNTGYYGCKKCGFYDQEREEYDKKVALEEKEIYKFNEAFLYQFLTKKGFEGTKGYDNFLEKEALKHKLIVIAIRTLGILIGLYLFTHDAMLNGIISGFSGWILGSLYKWIKFGLDNDMSHYSFLGKHDKSTTAHLLISKYKSKKMDESIENDLYF